MTTQTMKAVGMMMLLSVTLSAAAARADDEGERSVERRNRALLQRYHHEVWENRNYAYAYTAMAPDFFSHAQQPVLPSGVTPMPIWPWDLVAGFPDLVSHADTFRADGDTVIILWTITGTHDGWFLGIAPTHRPIWIQGMDILRVKDGKFVEHWGGYNDQIPHVVQQITQAP